MTTRQRGRASANGSLIPATTRSERWSRWVRAGPHRRPRPGPARWAARGSRRRRRWSWTCGAADSGGDLDALARRRPPGAGARTARRHQLGGGDLDAAVGWHRRHQLGGAGARAGRRSRRVGWSTRTLITTCSSRLLSRAELDDAARRRLIAAYGRTRASYDAGQRPPREVRIT
jgi:hypothetical protein